MSAHADALLGGEGPFVQALSGFRPRQPQQALARAIEQAIAERGTLVAEAGTGVGKTFAYLVPALMSGRKVLLSTGTRTLQDQLYHKDLPIVREALGVQVRAALLKGRANYLCRHRHALAEQEHRWRSREAARHLALVRRWLPLTDSGDLAEVEGLPEDSEILPRVTSTVENCLGLECPDYNDCFVVQARRRAQEADVVVINHHLFLADMALREEGFGELLPEADAVVLDEAHQLPDLASSFFGEQVSARQLAELARDSVIEQVNEAPEMASLRDTAGELERATRELRLAMGPEGRRGTRGELLQKQPVGEALEALGETLERLEQILEQAAERGKGLESCHGRCRLLRQRLRAWREEAGDQVAWFEVFRHGFSLNRTPLEVGSLFARQRARYPCAWVFTSATLAVAGDFGHFTRRLGIEGAEEQVFDSPFDFARQALLYLPSGMPDPRQDHFVEAAVERALPLLEANGGRAFFLFTSYRALNEAAQILRGKTELQLLVQGEMPRREMLARFRETPHSVLLGTSSFWEGVDVRGDELSLVIIDKLPFAAPNDPVMKARLEAIEAAGGNPFFDYQVPQAVIALKQGAGRLIRDVKDRGLLMICDPRLQGAGYGQRFLDSLPPFRRTSRPEEALAFLHSLREAVT